ncbi:hypothetical protein BJV77DRAFT_98000 [Russula vinacea]|nr:hypothetical protein BJV77DRAFT_98000 [Russula vinacea]
MLQSRDVNIRITDRVMDKTPSSFSSIYSAASSGDGVGGLLSDHDPWRLVATRLFLPPIKLKAYPLLITEQHYVYIYFPQAAKLSPKTLFCRSLPYATPSAAAHGVSSSYSMFHAIIHGSRTQTCPRFIKVCGGRATFVTCGLYRLCAPPTLLDSSPSTIATTLLNNQPSSDPSHLFCDIALS